MALILTAQPAMAHPHIFAKYEVDIAQKDKNTISLHFIFKIHNIVMLPNPLFHDQQQVTDNLFDALSKHPFYLFLDMDGQSLGQNDVELARAGGAEDEPIYTFDMDVPANAGSFGFSIYDPEYYDFVSLAGGDAIKIKIDSLTCATSYQEVGKTMWGINHATHVECGDKAKPIPHVSTPKNNRFERPDFNNTPLDKHMMLP